MGQQEVEAKRLSSCFSANREWVGEAALVEGRQGGVEERELCDWAQAPGMGAAVAACGWAEPVGNGARSISRREGQGWAGHHREWEGMG